MGEPPCEPLKPLVYLLDTDEVISEYESKYRQGEKQFKNYKQLNNRNSLEWFCNLKLIKLYELWDCKNLAKYKPTKTETDNIKAFSKSPTFKHGQVAIKAQLRSLGIKHPEELGKLAGMKNLEGLGKLGKLGINNPEGLGKLAGMKSLDERIIPAWEKALAYLESPALKARWLEAEKLNKLITPAYIETTKLALNAFNNNLNHKEILSKVDRYAKLTDQILNTGINAQIAWDMLEPHKSVTESLQLRLRSYESEEKPKETKKQLRKTIEQINEQLESKDKEIEELKTLIATSKKQDKEIEKCTRVHQLHTLIHRVDIALTKNKTKPQSQSVWNEIENNHHEYDDEAIIEEVKNNKIFWKSKGGKEQTLLATSFSATLSSIRNKYKNK